MRPATFLLERYFARHEFSARFLLSSSDCESLTLSALLSLADPEALALWQNLTLGYTESSGLPLLRQEIASLYSGLSSDHVLVAAPQEGIFLTLNALLSKGDHVIAPFPGYQSLYAVAEALGCEVTRWQPDEAKAWRFDAGFLRASLRPNTRLVVCNFPHNPTGFLPRLADFEELISILRERGVHLFSDEMYRYSEQDPAARLPSAVELYERAIALSGLSKSFGLPGLRIGWIATQDSVLRSRAQALRDYTTICSSAPSEVLALIALRARNTLLQRNVDLLRRNLATLDSFFQAQSLWFSWHRPCAGSVGFARLHDDQGAERFCQRAVQEAGVMLVPSSVFEYGDSHIRFGFGRENLPEALRRLGGWLTRN